MDQGNILESRTQNMPCTRQKPKKPIQQKKKEDTKPFKQYKGWQQSP